MQNTISIVSELDLSSSEDSVQTIQNIATKDGLVVIAGVNSSTADQQAGSNEHFRTYSVQFPPRRKSGDEDDGEKVASPPITLLGRSSIFRPSTATKKETYQRLLRLTRPRSREAGSKRLGAMATGFAPEAQIVIFDASETPSASSVRGNIDLQKGEEANDLDIAEHKDAEFGLVYCTDYEVHLHSWMYDFSGRKYGSEESRVLYTVPHPSKAGGRSRLRCLRWLSPHHVLLVLNTPNRTGGELLVLRFSSSLGPGKIVVRKSLPKSIKSVVSLATCPLDADPGSGDRQIIVAVAGQDISMHIFSVDYTPSRPSPISKLNHYKSLHDVHPLQISKIAFGNFFSPVQAPHSTMSIATMPQYIKLASVSMGNTVVVDTLTLSSTPTKPHDTARASTAKQHAPSVRWVLSAAGTELLRSWTGILVISFVVFITALLLQSYITASSSAASTTMRSYLPAGARADMRGPADKAAAGIPVASLVDNTPPQAVVSSPAPASPLADLISHPDHAIIVRDSPAGPRASTAPAADLERDPAAVPFDSLPGEQRERWKERLVDAGVWSVEQGEAVLKSVFFSQVAEVVGGAVRDAVLR